MPALNFQKQFVEKILSGEKMHTIRATRKSPIKVGDKLYLYTGMRTKSCKKLCETRCINSDKIAILENGDILINDTSISPASKHFLAIADGFHSLYHLLKWFDKNHGKYPFIGQIIKWGNIKGEEVCPE